MKNVLTFNGDTFLTLENIDSGADSIIIRYYIESPSTPKISVNGTLYDLTATGHGNLYQKQLDLSIVDETNFYIDFFLINGGTSYAQYKLVFYDFDDEGDFHINLWQKRLQVFQTGNTSVFHAYIIALVETDTTTIGDGLTVTDRAELKVNAGAGLTTTPDGKVAAIQALKNVDTIDCVKTGNNVTSVTINYDDETSNTYACTYNNDGDLTSFGSVNISYTT